MNKINYQQAYEEDINENIKTHLKLSDRFFDLTDQQRRLVEDLIDVGYKRAIEDALDPEILADTSALAADMGTQLYNFANLINSYLPSDNDEDGA